MKSMKTFIIANITTYIGMCNDAEHYYCSLYHNVNIDIEKNIQQLHRCRTSSDNDELYKILSKEDAEALSKKDSDCHWNEGAKVIRFNSTNEIHNELLRLFPNENIISYMECRPFKEMLIKIDGDIKPIDYMGQIWDYLPKSVYADLIPSNFNIKCECGKKYDLGYFKENIMVEQNYGDRPWIIFDIDMCECCKKPYLMWDVVL